MSARSLCPWYLGRLLESTLLFAYLDESWDLVWVSGQRRCMLHVVLPSGLHSQKPHCELLETVLLLFSPGRLVRVIRYWDLLLVTAWHTPNDNWSSNRPYRAANRHKVHIQRIYYIFEVKRNLDVEYLLFESNLSSLLWWRTFTHFGSNKQCEGHPHSYFNAHVILQHFHQPLCNTWAFLQLTLGHRYFAISFIIAQSAFLCSVVDSEACAKTSGFLFLGFEPFCSAAVGPLFAAASFPFCSHRTLVVLRLRIEILWGFQNLWGGHSSRHPRYIEHGEIASERRISRCDIILPSPVLP